MECSIHSLLPVVRSNLVTNNPQFEIYSTRENYETGVTNLEAIFPKRPVKTFFSSVIVPFAKEG